MDRHSMPFDPITSWHVPERAHRLAETLGDSHGADVVRHARDVRRRERRRLLWLPQLRARVPRVAPAHPSPLWRRLPGAHAKP